MGEDSVNIEVAALVKANKGRTGVHVIGACLAVRFFSVA
jgi:hypothetical protein